MFTYSPCSQCRSLNRVPLGQSESRQPVCGKCKAGLPLHGGINALGASELQLLVEKSPLPIVVDFWAPWCGPCRAFAPVFEQAAHQLAGRAVLVKVDTEANPLAGTTYRIRSIPTLAVFRGGFERARQSGALPLGDFLAWVESVTSQPAA